MTDDQIREALQSRFLPAVLKITDKSASHVGHPETMAEREKLLDLVIVSEEFTGKSLLERHAAIYACLAIGKTQTIHGITIRAYSPAEWQKANP